MAKDLSNHQKKIVNRYYEHHDTIQTTKLSELVTELYLCPPGKKADAMWKRAETALKRLEVKPDRLVHVMEKRDPAVLAKLVEELGRKSQ